MRCDSPRWGQRKRKRGGGGEEEVAIVRTSVSSPRVLKYRCEGVWLPLEAPVAASPFDMVVGVCNELNCQSDTEFSSPAGLTAVRKYIIEVEDAPP